MRMALFILAGVLCWASVAGAAVLLGDGGAHPANKRVYAASIIPQLIAVPELPDEPCACKRSGVCGQQQPAISGSASDIFARLLSGSALRPPGALGWFAPFVADLDPPPPRRTSA